MITVDILKDKLRIALSELRELRLHQDHVIDRNEKYLNSQLTVPLEEIPADKGEGANNLKDAISECVFGYYDIDLFLWEVEEAIKKYEKKEPVN